MRTPIDSDSKGLRHGRVAIAPMMNDVSNANSRVTNPESKNTTSLVGGRSDLCDNTGIPGAFHPFHSESLPLGVSERKRVLPSAEKKRKRSNSFTNSKKTTANEQIQARSYSDTDALDYSNRYFERQESSSSYGNSAARNGEDDNEFFGMSHDAFLAAGIDSQVDGGDMEANATGIDSDLSSWPIPDEYIVETVVTNDDIQMQGNDDNQKPSQSNLEPPIEQVTERVFTSNAQDSTSASAPSVAKANETPTDEPSDASFSPSDSTHRIFIDYDDITDKDVMCGREYSATEHKGNIQYLKLVNSLKSQYHSHGRSHREKTKIRNAIVDIIAENGGRFVAKTVDNRFYLQTKAEARFKVSQCLREKRNGKKNKA